MHTLDSFCAWLEATTLSRTIQTVEWVIPAVQTVHILAVASVVTAVLMLDLRLIGWGARDLGMAAVARRFLPFVWWPLPVLLASGATLIVAEPARALENPVFWLKMGLLAAAIGGTLASRRPLRPGSRLLAVLSFAAWVGIVFAGRWIAYVQGG